MTGRLCNRAHGRGRRTERFRRRLYNIIWWDRVSKFTTWDTSGPSYDAQGVAHQRSTEMCQSVWIPPVAHTTTPWRMAEVYATGSLTRVDDPDVVVYYLRRHGSSLLANPVSNQNHKVLCRAIGQGITQARVVVFRGEWIYECLFPCRRLLLEELPAPSGGLQQPSNQAVKATCHALRWRQRYCQTRYTRRLRIYTRWVNNAGSHP